jgi:hypothetical protein
LVESSNHLRDAARGFPASAIADKALIYSVHFKAIGEAAINVAKREGLHANCSHTLLKWKGFTQNAKSHGYCGDFNTDPRARFAWGEPSRS